MDAVLLSHTGRMCASDNTRTIWQLSNNELAIVQYGVRASGLQFPHRGLCGALLQVPEQRMVISQ